MTDRAKKIVVNPTAIFYPLKRMKITREKKQLCYRERNREWRIKYYHKLWNFIEKFRSQSLLFIDKSGFEDNQDCIYVWSKKGEKVYDYQEGKRGKRENLVAGRRKKEKILMAPIIFKGNLNAVGFEQWLNQHLLPSLKIPSVLIMDNSLIKHEKTLLEN